MIVPLTLKNDDCEDDTPREWSLIELNGELLPPKQLPSNKSSVELGAFEYDAEGKPVMTIASHELKGKVIELKEPFLVLRKRKRSSEEEEEENQFNREKVEFEITGIIKKKILFDNYPKSIMR